MDKVLGAEEFDEIEFQAVRTGNHVRAAVRMSELAKGGATGGMSRAEAYMRAGEQWLMADDPQAAVAEFRLAIEDGGSTFADPRVSLARALQAQGLADEARSLLAELTAKRDSVSPRTCDLLAELYADAGDLRTALDWATAGVDHCMARDGAAEDTGAEDKAELSLLLRLRYRLRNDLGLEEDDYDKMLDLRRPR